MSNLIRSTSPAPLMPLPSVGVAVRPGTMDDVRFLDSLQKLHAKQVGWMPTAQFEGKIKLGQVLIAELAGERVGYCIGSDRYFKHDDVGIIYQMNVAPERQRVFIGASLLKAQFDRSAYGCKLYCRWCAQDIAANRFWEAMGFVPLAFRAGSEKKSRVHIFWQRRIRAGDTTTPWWFPSQTSGGSIREDRIVLPIPPGTHWSDAKPMIYPQLPARQSNALPAPMRVAARKPKAEPVVKPIGLGGGGLRFAPAATPSPSEKPKREKSTKPKNDPRVVAAARELRDRWLEQVNATPLLGQAKYNVDRSTISESSPDGERIRLLPAA